MGSHPTQLLSFSYFSEASLSLCPSKVGIVLLGTNTQELPRATYSQFSQRTNFTCQKINGDLRGKLLSLDLPSGPLNPVPQQVMCQDLPAPFHLGTLTTLIPTTVSGYFYKVSPQALEQRTLCASKATTSPCSSRR